MSIDNCLYDRRVSRPPSRYGHRTSVEIQNDCSGVKTRECIFVGRIIYSARTFFIHGTSAEIVRRFTTAKTLNGLQIYVYIRVEVRSVLVEGRRDVDVNEK